MAASQNIKIETIKECKKFISKILKSQKVANKRLKEAKIQIDQLLEKQLQLIKNIKGLDADKMDKQKLIIEIQKQQSIIVDNSSILDGIEDRVEIANRNTKNNHYILEMVLNKIA